VQLLAASCCLIPHAYFQNQQQLSVAETIGGSVVRTLRSSRNRHNRRPDAQVINLLSFELHSALRGNEESND
jgi:hypothetical protein